MANEFLRVTFKVDNPQTIQVGQAILYHKKPVVILQIVKTKIEYGKFVIVCIIQLEPVSPPNLPQTTFQDIPVKLERNTNEICSSTLALVNGYPYLIVEITDLAIDTLNYTVRVKLSRIPTYDQKSFNRVIASQKSQSLGWRVI